MASLATQLGPLKLQNPIMTASGTFGYGEEIANFMDISHLGAVVCKTVTRAPRAGNAPPRTCETAAGMLNAIGLQNVGVERFITEKLPYLRQFAVPLIVNIAGETIEDFGLLAQALSQQAGVAALELNISCPNVAHGLDFATDPVLTEQVVAHARAATHLPIIAKLSPNVTDITLIARAAEAGGADAVSLVNTFVGMAVNIHTRRPRLSNISGGLSGPAIKPLALRAVYRCAQVLGIPLIGIGGIMNAQDAIEFFIAGASAVQVGTATFVQPGAALEVIQGLESYMDKYAIASIKELVGSIITT
ncbi:MAG: dihydroorotate dehydrogenase [Abitibacteriaceae bacterium]|nr:dihydroorotate dehydrogenase [Abditibacteriaceae bacterium]MBV9867205.1 dihydroorotate dehydrogenase [Abditibacteriaceae bacterium]